MYSLNKTFRLPFFCCVLLFAAAWGCTPVDCFHTKGDEIVSDREVPQVIDSLVIRGEVNVIIRQDYKNRLILKGGSNVLPWISTLVKGKTLTITDENECSFLRDLGFVADVEITVTNLKYFAIVSSGTIRSEGVLGFDTLVFEYLDGAGEVSLDVDAVSFRYQVMNGASGARLSGSARQFSLFADGFGPVDASGLTAGYLFVYHKGSNLLKVHPEQGGSLYAEIYSNGDIGYLGNPRVISVKQSGSGRLIKL